MERYIISISKIDCLRAYEAYLKTNNTENWLEWINLRNEYRKRFNHDPYKSIKRILRKRNERKNDELRKKTRSL